MLERSTIIPDYIFTVYYFHTVHTKLISKLRIDDTIFCLYIEHNAPPRNEDELRVEKRFSCVSV